MSSARTTSRASGEGNPNDDGPSRLRRPRPASESTTVSTTWSGRSSILASSSGAMGGSSTAAATKRWRSSSDSRRSRPHQRAQGARDHDAVVERQRRHATIGDEQRAALDELLHELFDEHGLPAGALS